MKWQDDPHREEKYLLLDGILKFLEKFHILDASRITMKDLCDFVDEFFKDWTNYYE